MTDYQLTIKIRDKKLGRSGRTSMIMLSSKKIITVIISKVDYSQLELLGIIISKNKYIIMAKDNSKALILAALLTLKSIS